MLRDRWGGIVGVTAGSSACRHAQWRETHGTGTQAPKGEEMTRSFTWLTALSRHPRMLLALPAAAALAATLTACGGGPSAHPAAPKPASVAHHHTRSAP